MKWKREVSRKNWDKRSECLVKIFMVVKINIYKKRKWWVEKWEIEINIFYVFKEKFYFFLKLCIRLIFVYFF